MIKEFFNIELLKIADTSIFAWQIAAISMILIIGYFLMRLLLFKWIPIICENNKIDKLNKRSVRRTFIILFFLSFILAVMFIIKWDFIFIPRKEELNISVRLIIEALMIFQLARLLDWFISHVLFYRYYKSRDQFMEESNQDSSIVGGKTSATNIIQYIVYTVAAILIISNFNLDFELYDINNGCLI
jgi:hypothetical protein